MNTQVRNKMEDTNSPKKIKKEKQIFRGHNDSPMLWSHIKHLQLEDDDVIRSEWVDDDNFDYHGYWHNEITRMVEETDEQFEKRIASNKRSNEEMKKRRYESYLRLKKEFENEGN
jgi:hypothetical protein